MEITQLEEMKARLMESNDEFRKLAEQHSEYKKRVEYLEHKSHPTDEELVEEQKLKKLKLRLKDQMTAMLESYRTQMAL